MHLFNKNFNFNLFFQLKHSVKINIDGRIIDCGFPQSIAIDCDLYLSVTIFKKI